MKYELCAICGLKSVNHNLAKVISLDHEFAPSGKYARIPRLWPTTNIKQSLLTKLILPILYGIDQTLSELRTDHKALYPATPSPKRRLCAHGQFSNCVLCGEVSSTQPPLEICNKRIN